MHTELLAPHCTVIITSRGLNCRIELILDLLWRFESAWMQLQELAEVPPRDRLLCQAEEFCHLSASQPVLLLG